MLQGKTPIAILSESKFPFIKIMMLVKLVKGHLLPQQRLREV